MKNVLVVILFNFTLPLLNASGQSVVSTLPSPVTIHNVVVYGDSSGAVAAAIAAKREGRSVIWINPTEIAGGMNSSRLGATDFLGYRNTFGGIASEFYDGIAKSYGTNFVRSFETYRKLRYNTVRLLL